MATKVIRYQENGAVAWGVVENDAVHRIDGDFDTTQTFMREAADRVREGQGIQEASRPVSEIEILCPVTRDRQFLCQAINYHSHMRESGIDPAGSPFNIFFRKASSCLASATAEIRLPRHVEFLDYEIEIGLVFSREVEAPIRVTMDNLGDYVGALVAVNDVSARDIQLPEGQFYKGKSYRSFGPAGPYLTLVSPEELRRFEELHLILSVNGETRQDSLANDMVHQPPGTLTELSGLQDWQAGDLLATGTPGGCALQAPAKPLAMLAQIVSPKRRQALVRRVAANNPLRLRPGDTIEASIRTDDGAIDLGRQRNQVVSVPDVT